MWVVVIGFFYISLRFILFHKAVSFPWDAETAPHWYTQEQWKQGLQLYHILHSTSWAISSAATGGFLNFPSNFPWKFMVIWKFKVKMMEPISQMKYPNKSCTKNPGVGWWGYSQLCLHIIESEEGGQALSPRLQQAAQECWSSAAALSRSNPSPLQFLPYQLKSKQTEKPAAAGSSRLIHSVSI